MKLKKILMVTMQMGIGGAETHILELSRALTMRGYCVHVVSRGGSFVEELEASGIKHFSLPLNTRRPSDILKSIRGLKKLIKAEKYDIVHAHARIPAAICAYLSKKMGFRFVTTAHWVFKVTPLYRLLSDWGQKSLAVSEDIKQYLIDEYGVFPDNIRVTVNALDTDKYDVDVTFSAIKSYVGEEFVARYTLYFVAPATPDHVMFATEPSVYVTARSVGAETFPCSGIFVIV